MASKHPAAHVHAGASAAKGHAKAVAFAANIADTIAAGLPVEEQRTTRFGPRSSQTETRLIQPNNVNSSTLTTSTITLPGNGGTERVTDFSYQSLTNSTVHVITTVLPDGSVQTEDQTLTVQGNTTQINAAVKLRTTAASARSAALRSSTGPVTTTDEMVTEPDGTVHHDQVASSTANYARPRPRP